MGPDVSESLHYRLRFWNEQKVDKSRCLFLSKKNTPKLKEMNFLPGYEPDFVPKKFHNCSGYHNIQNAHGWFLPFWINWQPEQASPQQEMEFVCLEFMISLLSIYEPSPYVASGFVSRRKPQILACREVNKSEMVNNKSESREEQITRCGLSVGGMSVRRPTNTGFRELNMHGGPLHWWGQKIQIQQLEYPIPRLSTKNAHGAPRLLVFSYLIFLGVVCR